MGALERIDDDVLWEAHGRMVRSGSPSGFAMLCGVERDRNHLQVARSWWMGEPDE